MSRIRMKHTDDQIYRAHLCYEPQSFAEEIDKRRYLVSALRRLGERKIHLLSFVLLNNDFFLLFSAEDQAVLLRNEENGYSADGDHLPAGIEVQAGSMLDRILRKEIMQEGWKGDLSGSTEIIALSGCPGILQECIRLHNIPVEWGYVSDPADYWWSGYQNYHDTYYWQSVDTQKVLGMVAEDGERAREHFLKLHLDRGVSCFRKPEC